MEHQNEQLRQLVEQQSRRLMAHQQNVQDQALQLEALRTENEAQRGVIETLGRGNTALAAENGTVPAYTASEPPVRPTPAHSGNNDALSDMMECMNHMSDMEIAYALLDLREATQPGPANSVSPLPVPVNVSRASVTDQNSRGGGAAAGSNSALATTERVLPASQQRLAGAISTCLLYTSPSPRDGLLSRMPSSA